MAKKPNQNIVCPLCGRRSMVPQGDGSYECGCGAVVEPKRKDDAK